MNILEQIKRLRKLGHQLNDRYRRRDSRFRKAWSGNDVTDSELKGLQSAAEEARNLQRAVNRRYVNEMKVFMPDYRKQEADFVNKWHTNFRIPEYEKMKAEAFKENPALEAYLDKNIPEWRTQEWNNQKMDEIIPDSHIRKLWEDYEAFSRIRNDIPTEMEIKLNPSDFIDHPSNLVSDYAKSLISSAPSWKK